MRALEYPFCAEEIIKNRKALVKQLKNERDEIFIEKKIAILGGFTTRNIKNILELFLLNYGINPVFYESEYNQYYEDGMFKNEKLEEFAPDLIYICTSVRNINEFPNLSDNIEIVEQKLLAVCDKFRCLWEQLTNIYHCPIIQNNFEYPYFRLLGNKDASDIHGRVNFVTKLNLSFYEYTQKNSNLYICDINYLSASYGLEKWSDSYYWYMYKYAVSVPAIPYLAFNIANIIKSIYGKNKKVLNLDLDNTLWGGIIGDDGIGNIEIGQETPTAQAYSDFQEYLKLHNQLGILLSVNSKNEKENALRGLEHPDSVLKADDFVIIKANWKLKSENLLDTAKELCLLPESFVFVDDNPAERDIISSQISGVAVPEINRVENYISIIDKSGFFELTSLSVDDLKRTKMYQDNVKRDQLQKSFANYEDYLITLEMEAEIQSFNPIYISRIAQLTNKSNQFNLTTKRYSQTDIERVMKNSEYITLYGRLKDKFGDNGVVSVIIGKLGDLDKGDLYIQLWLMSCRVLKRNMEYAMMDELVKKSRVSGVKRIIGYYYPTAKNRMVKEFYKWLGFTKISEDKNGNTKWKYDITDNYCKKQEVIRITKTE